MQTVGQKEECCTRGTVDGVFEQTPTLTLWNRQTGYYEYSAQRQSEAGVGDKMLRGYPDTQAMTTTSCPLVLCCYDFRWAKVVCECADDELVRFP